MVSQYAWQKLLGWGWMWDAARGPGSTMKAGTFREA